MLKENYYIKQKWTTYNKKHYTELGHIFTEYGSELMALQEHLPKNSKEKIIIKCDYCGEEFEKNMVGYVESKRKRITSVDKDYCKKCRNKHNKEMLIEIGHTKENYYNDYKHKFEDRGYEIISYEIPDKRFKVKYKCKNHPDKILEVSLIKFDMGRGCRYCGFDLNSKNRRLSIEKVREKFTNKDLTLLTEEYTNSRTVLSFTCNKHPNHIQKTYAGNLYRDRNVCKYCATEAVSGENNCNWNGGLSEFKIALRDDLRKWVFDSLKQCDFKCSLSQTEFKNEHVHHYYESFEMIIKRCLSDLSMELKELKIDYANHDYIVLRDKILNEHYRIGLGRAVAPQLHTLFHKLYGYHNNTPQQFDEFTLRYKLKEFNDTQALPKKLWSK